MLRTRRPILAGMLFVASVVLIVACGNDDTDGFGEATGSVLTPSLPPSDSTDAAHQDPNHSSSESGRWTGLTIEQARQLVQFEILEPNPVPAPFEFRDATVIGHPIHVETPPNRVVLHFNVPMASTVTLEQTSLRAEVNVDHPLATQTAVSINESEIVKTIRPQDDGTAVVAYNWHVGDVYFVLNAVTSDDVTEADIEALIAAL